MRYKKEERDKQERRKSDVIKEEEKWYARKSKEIRDEAHSQARRAQHWAVPCGRTRGAGELRPGAWQRQFGARLLACAAAWLLAAAAVALI